MQWDGKQMAALAAAGPQRLLLGHPGREKGAPQIGVEVTEVIGHGGEYGMWHLSAAGAVEEDGGFALNQLIESGKLAAQHGDIESLHKESPQSMLTVE